MRRIWRLKHFEFEDFAQDESGVAGEGDNALTLPAKRNIEEFVMRFLDPLWEGWDRICAFNGWLCGINIRTAYIRKSVCDALPERYRWYYWGYTAEIYPTNGRTEDFISFVKMFASMPRVVYDDISISENNDEVVRVVFKRCGGKPRRNINL